MPNAALRKAAVNGRKVMGATDLLQRRTLRDVRRRRLWARLGARCYERSELRGMALSTGSPPGKLYAVVPCRGGICAVSARLKWRGPAPGGKRRRRCSEVSALGRGPARPDCR